MKTPDTVAMAAAALAAVAFLGAGPVSGTTIHDGAVGAPAVAQAADDPGRKVIVSLEQKKLWLVQGRDTLFSAPVAIGKGTTFRFAGKSYRFDTPRGERRILAKLDDPNWIPPDWHYYEKAVYRGLEPIHLEDGDRFELSDGTYIEVRNKEVGRVNRWGNYYPFTPGSEIMFDGYIFIPPFGSPQREIPNALGPVKLSLGDGYLIHGTHRYNTNSIGTAASHGCIRMNNEDVAKLRDMVQVGTIVQIY